MSGTAGKIAGRVTDAQTGEPLPGANVVIEGTTMGAPTDGTGAYAILNVPPGVYTVKASMMGFQDVRIQNVKVSIDLTTTVDFKLGETVLEVAAPVTVTAERPVVQKDMTSALSSVSSEQIKALPVTEVRDVLQLQVGLVKDPFGGLHVRGGRSGEINYQIDGITVTDTYDGSIGVEVENAMVQELQVISGTFNAEYGNAMSGVINIVTREGGAKYSGQINTWVGDYIPNPDDTVFAVVQPRGTRRADFQSPDPASVKRLRPLNGYNRILNFQGTFSGPVPGLGDKVNFFVTGRYYDTRGWFYGQRWFTPQGIFLGDTANVPKNLRGEFLAEVPMNPFRKFSAEGKIAWRVRPTIKVAYTLFWNDNKFKYYDHFFKYTPDALLNRFEKGFTHIGTWTHVLSANTFYEAKLTRFSTDYKHYLYSDPEKVLKGQEKLAQVRYIRDRTDTTRYYVDPKGPKGYVHPDSLIQPAPYSFARAGTPASHVFRNTSYTVGKVDFTSQVTKTHQMKTGAELRLYDLSLEEFEVIPKVRGGQPIVPFEPDIPPLSYPNHNRFQHNPIEFAAYAQDKMEFKDLIVNIGVRFDLFEPDGVVLRDESDPNINDPFKPEHRYKNWAPGVPDSLLVEYTAAERAKFWYKDATVKTQVSPRLGMAYPITDRGVIHFSYGWFFQVPTFEWLYANPDLEVPRTSGLSTIIGNADLKPQRTVMYEVGLQQQLSEDIGMDVTLFYRDIRDWVGTGPLIPTAIPSVQYTKFVNLDYSNVRGITLSLNKRYSNYFSANLDYSFMVAEGSNSDPRDAFNAARAGEEPRIQLIPLGWDQTHTLNATVTLGTESWRASLIGRYWSGTPYTPRFAVGTIAGAGTFTGLRVNSARKPDTYTLDLRLYKSFTVGTLRPAVFVNIFNLLDRRNETGVYDDTGRAFYTLDVKNASADPKRISLLQDYITRPDFYSEPRQIQVGVSVEF